MIPRLPGPITVSDLLVLGPVTLGTGLGRGNISNHLPLLWVGRTLVDRIAHPPGYGVLFMTI